MLQVAAELADGAHPFLATPEHTNRAREILGDGGLLAVEQGVILDPPEQAHELARDNLSRFLEWPNYRRHFERLGFGDTDFTDGGNNRLLNSVFVIGDQTAVQERIQEHLDAGADHVCLQIVTNDMDEEMNAYRHLAPAVRLS